MTPPRIYSRNALFQQMCALRDNRTKRHRAGAFLVQGVRPITMAVEHGWTIESVLHDGETTPSAWARDLMDRLGAPRVATRPDLLSELAEKSDGRTELVAVASMPPDDLDRLPVDDSFAGLVFDRPTQPGNIGAILRSCDAFRGTGLIVTGHGADPYDPKSVRASTGSLFAVPTVRSPSPRDVLAWVRGHRDRGRPITVLATDEHGTEDVSRTDLTGPVLILVGNETTGLANGWREGADRTIRIPMGGSASSLNASNAATVLLYEMQRQRLA